MSSITFRMHSSNRAYSQPDFLVLSMEYSKLGYVQFLSSLKNLQIPFLAPSNQKLSLHNHNNHMSTSATLYFFGRLLSYWNDERINKLSNSKTMRLILRSGICNPNWAHPFKIQCPPYGTILSR